MKLTAWILALLLTSQAQAASDAIYLPNLSKNATGTTAGAKSGLDTNVASGGGMQTEDAVHASGDSGVMALCVRNDAGAALAADGDYIPCTTDSTGALRVNATEVATVANAGALPGLVKVVAGYDGAAVKVLKTDAGGALQVDVESSALPTGAATEAKQDTIIGHVDGLETLIGTTNSSLTTIDGRVDGLEALVGTTNTTLSTINSSITTVDGHVDGLETLVGTTNSTLTTIDGRVDGLEALVGTTNSTLTTIDGHVDGIEALLTTSNTNTGQTPQNANVTDSTNQTVGVAAVSESAPSDAVGFILSADPANTGIVYYRLGGTATTSAGHPLEASRDSGFLPVKANLSIIASAASQKYNLTWIRR